MTHLLLKMKNNIDNVIKLYAQFNLQFFFNENMIYGKFIKLT